MADSQPTLVRPETWAIALDGGTTNTRARLLHGHRIIATSRRSVGVRDTVLGDPVQPAPQATDPAPAKEAPGQPHRDRLVRAVREVVEEVARALVPATMAPGDVGSAREHPEFIVASGMLSSEVGLVAIPHLSAPAGLDELARGVAVVDLPEVAAMPIYVVPGVRTPAGDGTDGWFEADVMRRGMRDSGSLRGISGPGADRARPVAGLPLAGFAYQAGRSRPLGTDHAQPYDTGRRVAPGRREAYAPGGQPARGLPDDPDPERRGGRACAVESGGLGRAAFLVRIAALIGRLDPRRRASFWIGATVSADVIGLAASSHPQAGLVRSGSVDGSPCARSTRPSWPAAMGARHHARRAPGRIGSGPGPSQSPLAESSSTTRTSGPADPRRSPQLWPNRLQDQTTWPMIIRLPSPSSNSTGIKGKSRPLWFGRRMMWWPCTSSHRTIGTPSGHAATI